MRAQVVAAGVFALSLMCQLASAQGFGAAPASRGSVTPPPPAATPPPTAAAPARTPSPHMRSPGGGQSVFADPRPQLGNAPAQPLTTRGPVDLYRARPDTYQRITPPWLNPYWFGGGYAVAPYDRSDEHERTTTARRAPVPPPGYLVFRVQPASAEVYVDGYYIGTVADLAAGRALPEGPYRLELRASGFDTVTTDVRILAGETITFNRFLTRTPVAPPPTVARVVPPAPAKPFYVIRGCYAGSTHPKDVKLPAGCDVKNVRVVPPVVNEVTRPRS
jgi:hypothetical protein